MSLSAWLLAELPMTAVEKEWSQRNVENENGASTDTDNLKAIYLELQPVQTEQWITGKVQTPIKSMIHGTVADGFRILITLSVAENSSNEWFKELKEELGRCAEEVIS